jgi:putative membrane protein
MRFIHAVLVLSLACASGGSEAAQDEADTAGRRDSVAAVAAGSMGEEHVLSLLELTHSADSALGSLGAQKGGTADIKDFGRMVTREHIALRRDVAAVAEQLGVAPQTPPVPPDEAPAVMHERLIASGDGPAWDRAYLDYAVAVHESALENTARALAATKRPEIKQLIEKSVPILQKHLDKAKSLRRALPRNS